MCKQSVLIMVLTGLLSTALAQDPWIRKYELQSNGRQQVVGEFTAIVFKSEAYHGETVPLTINGETLTLPRDPDAPDHTYFLSVDGTQTIQSLGTGYDGELHLINSGEAPRIANAHRMQQADCSDELDPILQQEWRAGLPAPSYTRRFTNVDHLIVHHSAGSNTSTNYTQVVRDIYIYHTQSNGWSDIGYNYLIAQNGALYAGRDPASGEQDNVLGAHFCGSNSNTMGVCLLGNYESALATDDSWQTLQQVARYKMKKEGLDPTAGSSHPLGQMGHVAGHRDGCSTACPGQNVYDLLGAFKQEVRGQLNACDNTLEATASSTAIDAGTTIVFTNLSEGYDSYLWNLEGADPSTASWSQQGHATYHYAGTFDLELIGLVAGTPQDTLTYEDFITVTEELKLFPNPAQALAEIYVATNSEIHHVTLLGLDGKAYFKHSSIEGHRFQLPHLRQGLYLLRIYTSEGLVKRKLLVL